MLSGFKDFIARGNAIDLAVGVIIGAAFSTVVDTLVEAVLNPLIGLVFGKPDFSSILTFEWQLWGEPAVVSFGAVLTALLNFLIVAVALYFFVVMPLNKLAEMRAAKDEEPEEEDRPEDVVVLEEIRDLLKANATEK